MYMGSAKLLNELLVIRKLLEDEKGLAVIDKKIHEEKVGLRNQYRERCRYDDGWTEHYTDYDSCWGKKVVPYEMSEEDIEEYIEAHWQHWYNPYEDGRDCTGVWFTTSIRCFPINGKTFIYHFQSCDV